jgi:predicted ATPase
LTALIPELERLTGRCLPPPVLAFEAAKQRFKYVSIEFLRACARPAQPLLLFLDDVQWADPASRSLLSSILPAPELRQEVAFFLILAHRNEQDYKLEWLDQLEAQIPITEFSCITLNPLSIESYTTLIAESLHQPLFSMYTLAEMLYEKKNGW